MSDPIEKQIIYIEGFFPKEVADMFLLDFQESVPWVRRDATPRLEAFYSEIGDSYTYGSGGFSRTYVPEKTMHPNVDVIRKVIEFNFVGTYDLCFLNRYLNQSDHLGWHSDDSPEVNPKNPIAIISLGVERDIMFRSNKDNSDEYRLKLGHGSLCIMPAGFQQTHQHRIPKSGIMCGERISLTYRGATK